MKIRSRDDSRPPRPDPRYRDSNRRDDLFTTNPERVAYGIAHRRESDLLRAHQSVRFPRRFVMNQYPTSSVTRFMPRQSRRRAAIADYAVASTPVPLRMAAGAAANRSLKSKRNRKSMPVYRAIVRASEPDGRITTPEGVSQYKQYMGAKPLKGQGQR